jgi:hypothetical protein
MAIRKIDFEKLSFPSRFAIGIEVTQYAAIACLSSLENIET